MRPFALILMFIFLIMPRNAVAGAGFHASMQLESTQADRRSCLFCHADDHNFGSGAAGAVAQSQPAKDGEAISRACAGCHNGIEADTMIIRAPGCGNPGEGEGFFGTHPVFVSYDRNKPVLKEGESPLEGLWYKAARVNDLLRNEKVVCVSCHDPHNTAAKAFLRNPISLCKGCHLK